MSQCPVCIITLSSQEQRTKDMRLFIDSINADNVQWIDGINGHALKKCAGRLRTVDDKGHLRLSWTDTATKQRCVRHLHFGKCYSVGLVEPWGMAGCCMSHALALEAGLTANQDYFLVLENDCSTDVPQLFWQILKKAVDGMPEGWTVLQLGVDSAGPAPLSRRACHRNIVLDDFVGKLRVSERNCLAHAYAISKKGAAEMLHVLQDGRTPDAALMSLQGRCLRRSRRGCFHFSPSLVRQHRPTDADPSTTCTFQSWSKGMKGWQQKGPMGVCDGARQRGKRKITRAALSRVKKQSGKTGGKEKAGNGSSAEQIRDKSRKINSFYRRTGRWPSKNEAHKRWQISNRLWTRLKAEACDNV